MVITNCANKIDGDGVSWTESLAINGYS
jgi:hypothetical protein